MRVNFCERTRRHATRERQRTATPPIISAGGPLDVLSFHVFNLWDTLSSTIRALLTPSGDYTLCETRPPQHATLTTNRVPELLRILRTAAEQAHVTTGYVYGSILRDDFVPGTSDIDILLVVADASDGSIVRFLNCMPEDIRMDLDLSPLTENEVDAQIHPGWSKHYFFNVNQSGICFHGIPLLKDIDARALSAAEAYRRLTQLTQRTRFVLTNPRKHDESSFWLNKYQYWVPLCLMELLALHGYPEFRLKYAMLPFSSASVTSRHLSAIRIHLCQRCSPFLNRC